MWKTQFSKNAIKKINKIDNSDLIIIKNKIKNLQNWFNNTEDLSIDLKKLKGKWKDFYRIKSRKIRILLKIDKNKKLISIYDVGYRRDIYK